MHRATLNVRFSLAHFAVSAWTWHRLELSASVSRKRESPGDQYRRKLCWPPRYWRCAFATFLAVTPAYPYTTRHRFRHFPPDVSPTPIGKAYRPEEPYPDVRLAISNS